MKSKTAAYLFWWFLGVFGGHRYYLGQTKMGLLYTFTFGLFWIGWFIDLFKVGKMVDEYNAKVVK